MNEAPRIVCYHLNQVGDLLFSLPAIYNLRTRFPNAHIISVARPSSRSLLQLSGLVDEVIERPHGNFASEFRVAKKIRDRRPDLALLFSTSTAVWVMAQLSGCREKVGFVHSLGGFLLSKKVEWSPPPSTANNIRLVQAIGCDVTKRDYVGLIKLGQKEQDEANRILATAGIGLDERFIVLSPGTSGGREYKCWPDKGFAEVADMVYAEFGIRSVVVGLDGGEAICSLSSHVVDLTGKTSLTVLAAILERASSFVGVDSGAMHLAACMGTPVVALYGPTDPSITGPQDDGHVIVSAGVDCAPCFGKGCNYDRRCMELITSDEVFRAVAGKIRNSA